MRKNLLANLVGSEAELTPVNSDLLRLKAAPMGSRGAVGAMSRTLAQFSNEREAAAKLMTGQEVVEVDPVLIDRSIVKDRMAGPETDHLALVQSIREHGQQVPVLLRPHPSQTSRFQIAYGHRRVEALRSLAIPVRAVVRPLTDAELVIAQGQENSARKDLSFIERATFGLRLEDLKFGRETIMAALSVDKTELSRLIAVARAVPAELIEAIGAAPRAGRRRWMDLAAMLEAPAALNAAKRAASKERFCTLESDSRFSQILAAASPGFSRVSKSQLWSGISGNATAKILRVGSRVTVTIDRDPEFGEFVAENLDEFYRQFQSRRSRASN